MARKVRMAFLSAIAAIVFLASVYHNLFRHYQIPVEYLRQPPVSDNPQNNVNYAIREEVNHQSSRHVSFVPAADSISSVSILLPAWEVLVILSPETTTLFSDSSMSEYACLFANNDTSPAKPARSLQFTNRKTFKCLLPNRVRRRLPFLQPMLTKSPANRPEREYPVAELMRWNFLVYESISTENDVILFVKGLNNRQGMIRQPTEFRCVFGDDVINGVKTAVTTSFQEVFRCQRPELTAVFTSGGDEQNERIKISVEISEEKRVVPSVAYHTPVRTIAIQKEKSLLCACTMVYNVAKFLKEWVVYHSKIGVEKFILYDNDSDDDLEETVEELVEEGHDVRTLFWLWPKTQEAGFSHCAIYAKDSCTWMLYIDVDEFVYSPSWLNSSQPSNHMLKSLLPIENIIGQVMISCYEFGPSNHKSHPVLGVTQGYNCRRQSDNRHKSIVLLDAIDESLLNVIHHFRLREGYRNKKLRIQDAAVNHYKYQAWPEFKAKFRRRVSAYVVDWTKAVNPMSKDRTPGLGFAPIEPSGWPEKFCEVHDNRLTELTRRWFGSESPLGYQMAWQR
uniref:Glycosyltransferase family 92 protein n=1 Tax=Davidia involucrata TaxID=16924 RepID=A0A5B7C0E1_DAVIN